MSHYSPSAREIKLQTKNTRTLKGIRAFLDVISLTELLTIPGFRWPFLLSVLIYNTVSPHHFRI